MGGDDDVVGLDIAVDDVPGVTFPYDLEQVDEDLLEAGERDVALLVVEGHEVDARDVVEDNHKTIVGFIEFPELGYATLSLHEMQDLPFGGNHGLGGETLLVDFADHFGCEALAGVLVVNFVNLSLQGSYLREAAFSYEVQDFVFVGEVKLDGILDNFFLLVLPKGGLVEKEEGSFGAVGEHQQVPLAVQSKPLHIDVLDVAVPQVLIILNVLNFIAGTLK